MSTSVAELVGGRYELANRMGVGGSGAVYRARDLHLRRTVALKILDTGPATDPTARRRLVLEAKTLARLRHPCLPLVYDLAEPDDEPLWLAMQLIDGLPLNDPRAVKALSLNEIGSVLTDVAAALDAVHGEGIVHRDVKPANIVLGTSPPHDHAFLVDLGIAKSQDGTALTEPLSVLGTAQYLAPERCLGEPATSSSDIYALGCTAYFLLTGEAPFRAPDTRALMLAHVNRPVPRLPIDLATLQIPLDAAMAKEPSDRPASASAFASAFAAHLNRPALPSEEEVNSARALDAPLAEGTLPTASTALLPRPDETPAEVERAPHDVYRVTLVALMEAMRDEPAILDLQARLAELAQSVHLTVEAGQARGTDSTARIEAEVAGGSTGADAFVRAALLVFGDAKRALVRSVPVRLWHPVPVPGSVDLAFLHAEREWSAWVQRNGGLAPM